MGRRSVHGLALALLSGAGCGGGLPAGPGGPAGETPHPAAPIWERAFRAHNAPNVQLVSWPNGDLALIGLLQTNSAVAFDGFQVGTSTAAQPFVARIDGQGNVQRAWEDVLGGSFAAVDPGGSLYMAGDVVRKIGPDGGVAWSKEIHLTGYATSVVLTNDGALNLFGTFAGTFDLGGGPVTARNGGHDNFRIRVDANGAFISAETFGDPLLPVGRVVASPSGSFASIATRGNGDWSVQVLDAGGHVSWSRTFARYAVMNGGFHVAFSGDDVIVGAGIEDDTDLGDGPFPGDVPHRFAVARYNQSGGLLWKRAFGTDYNAYLDGLAVDAHGDIALCGFVSHLTDQNFVFDSVTIPWSDELGFSFVGKLAGTGHARWAQKIIGVDNFYAAPSCAVDAAGALLVADGYAREDALYVAKYAP
jgi:hypothetical protein